MKKLLFQSFVELSNHRLQSYVLKSFASSKWSKPLVPMFVKTFKLNNKEMLEPIESYSSLHTLFIRHLKPESRPVAQERNAFVSPVDGILASQGSIERGSQFTIKGQQYSLEEMLGSDVAATPYHEGAFFVLYLSPSHYHRIHSPVSCQIINQWSLGGRSYPVNELGMTYGKRPLSRNYRIISELQYNEKKIALVKVGAMNINTIELTHDSASLSKGEEIGYFSFGSTIVLLVEKGLLKFEGESIPMEVKMGQKIATIL
ncbi:phosphatidylserine decarboxylase [Bacillus solitudinis]|uniref:phosphatidylserine decarboxylase n=1 Tax=Bacillus solitudinis TaxID=2014074 RepID=UPI003872F953